MNGKWIAGYRRHGGLLAVFNRAARPQRVPLPHGEWERVLASDGKEAELAGAMPAHQTHVYKRRR